jgi:hypothetical protein
MPGNNTCFKGDYRSRISNSAEKANTKHSQLWVGFCSTKKEEIYKLEGGSQATCTQHTSKIHLLRRFILLRELSFLLWNRIALGTVFHIMF